MNVTLDDIARGYLISQGKNTLHGYVKIMKHIVDFLRGFSMDNHYMDNVTVLELDEKKAVQFPDDAISIKTIAWQSGDRILKFEADSRLSLHVSREDDVASATPNTAFDMYQAWPFNGVGSDVINSVRNADGSMRLLGRGDNGLGYFRINYKEREIQFNANTPAPWKIYIEYKSNGFHPTTKSTIPEFAAKVAEEYVHWQLGRAKFGDASAEAEARRIRYRAEYDEMLARLDTLDVEGITGAMARSFDINRVTH